VKIMHDKAIVGIFLINLNYHRPLSDISLGKSSILSTPKSQV